MKIKSLRVGTYGKMRDRSFELEPGLNVFYGPNEAGKSTLRSFITNTLFPGAGIKYPQPKAGDQGQVVVELDNGNTLTYERDGKKSSGTGPQICGIDDKEYVSIYSMSPADLRDVKSIQNGDIRNRFLTVPGGSDLPAAYEALDKERTALMPDGRRSAKCEIAQLIDREHRLGQEVKRLQMRESGDSHYAELTAERDSLKEKLKVSEGKVAVADQARLASHREDATLAAKEEIAGLEEEEKKISYAEGTDTVRIADLESDYKRLKEEADRREERYDRSRIRVADCPADAYARTSREIDSLNGNTFEYERRKRQGAPAASPNPTYSEPRGGLPLIPIIGGIIAVAGLAVAALFNIFAGIGMVAAGAVIAVIGLRSKPASRPAPVRSASSEDDFIKFFDNRVGELSKELNIRETDPVKAVGEMVSNRDALVEVEKLRRDFEDARKTADAAREKADVFYDGFGGKEKYLQAAKDAERLKEVRTQLAALRKTVDNVEPAAVDTDTADTAFDEATSERAELQQQLASVEQAIKDISEDTTVEDAITAASDASTDVYNACLDWARLMLEKIILDRATEKAYGEHRPDVVTRADRFLDAMTGGRYRMDTDPRSEEIGVVDRETGEVKTGREWSSGLEDQVKLSLKMAVSLSLSKEKPPVILDDILLTSDSERKEGACRALAMLSEGIQVLYFTCDRETRDLMEGAGAAVQEV